MKAFAYLAVAGLAFAAPAAPALAQGMMMMSAKPVMVKIVGTVAAATATALTVTTSAGTTPVVIGPKTRIALSMPISIDQIKAGSYVGAGAQATGKGTNKAMEITVFPESARGLGEGFRKWDAGPTSTMTNGTVSQVVGTSNRTITVTYKGGQQQVTIPDGTPIVTFAAADASALSKGAHVVVRGTRTPTGAIAANFVSVGKDGSVPPG